MDKVEKTLEGQKDSIDITGKTKAASNHKSTSVEQVLIDSSLRTGNEIQSTYLNGVPGEYCILVMRQKSLLRTGIRTRDEDSGILMLDPKYPGPPIKVSESGRGLGYLRSGGRENLGLFEDRTLQLSEAAGEQKLPLGTPSCGSTKRRMFCK